MLALVAWCGKPPFNRIPDRHIVWPIILLGGLVTLTHRNANGEDEGYAASLFEALRRNNDALHSFNVSLNSSILNDRQGAEFQIQESRARLVRRGSDGRCFKVSIARFERPNDEKSKVSSGFGAWLFGAGQPCVEFREQGRRTLPIQATPVVVRMSGWSALNGTGLRTFPQTGTKAEISKGSEAIIASPFRVIDQSGTQCRVSLIGEAYGDPAAHAELEWTFDTDRMVPVQQAHFLVWESDQERERVLVEHIDWILVNGILVPSVIQIDSVRHERKGDDPRDVHRWSQHKTVSFQWHSVNEEIDDDWFDEERYVDQRKLLELVDPIEQ